MSKIEEALNELDEVKAFMKRKICSELDHLSYKDLLRISLCLEEMKSYKNCNDKKDV